MFFFDGVYACALMYLLLFFEVPLENVGTNFTRCMLLCGRGGIYALTTNNGLWHNLHICVALCIMPFLCRRQKKYYRQADLNVLVPCTIHYNGIREYEYGCCW